MTTKRTARSPHALRALYDHAVLPMLTSLPVDATIRLRAADAPSRGWWWLHSKRLGITLSFHRVHPDIVVLRLR